jgi:acyl dehydratase
MPSQPPQVFVLPGDRAEAFAAAYGDTFVDGGRRPQTAPPLALAIGTLVLGVAPVLRATLAGGADAPLLRVVHLEEEMRWHKPLQLDTPYRISAALSLHEVRPAGEFLHIDTQASDAAGALLASTRSTLFVRPPSRVVVLPTKGAPAGPLRPCTPLAPWQVAEDQPERYARASLDTNPIHLHDGVAQAAGLPGRILHGMCTLAYGARALTCRPGAGSRPRLTYLRARFGRPVFPNDVLTCRLYPAQDGADPFDVVQQDGSVVLSRGLARFAEPSIF